MKRVGSFLLALLSLLLFVTQTSHASSQSLMITRVRVGGTATLTTPQEHVDITNVGSDTLALGDEQFVLEYYKTPTSGTVDITCGLYPWGSPSSNYVRQFLPEINLSPGETIQTVMSGGMPDARGGSLRLVETDQQGELIHDLLGWNGSSSQSACYEAAPVVMSSAGGIAAVSRLVDYNGHPIDTNNNAADFVSQFTPAIDYCRNQSGIQTGIPSGYEVNQDGNCIQAPEEESEGGNSPTENDCSGLVVSEIGANLSLEQQFIEVYNSTREPMLLKGCKLMTNRSNSTAHVFGDEELESDSYATIFIKNTSLTLTKTTTGTVYILSSDGGEVNERYYENLKEGTSWSWFGDEGWRQTYKMTPGEENILQEFADCPNGQERSTETGRCRNRETESAQGTCPEGKYRNPATNRCKNIGSNTGLKPCAADQVRNAETNRCRKISSATSSLTPCKPGQERNPATNRCRKVGTDSATLKPCQAGYERNPETNRCRKVKASNSSLGAPAAINPVSMNSRIVSVLVIMAIAYAVYEYRTDIAGIVNRLRNKRGNPRPPG